MVSEGPLQTANEYAFYDPLPRRQYPLISATAWLAPKPNRRFINYWRNFLPFRSAVVSRWSPDTLLRPGEAHPSPLRTQGRSLLMAGARAEGTQSRKDVAMLEFLVSHRDEVTGFQESLCNDLRQLKLISQRTPIHEMTETLIY